MELQHRPLSLACLFIATETCSEDDFWALVTIEEELLSEVEELRQRIKRLFLCLRIVQDALSRFDT